MSIGEDSIKRVSSNAKQGKTMTEKQVTEKKSVPKKTTQKKVVSSTIPSVSPEVITKMQLSGSEPCHLTEELPVYLL